MYLYIKQTSQSLIVMTNVGTVELSFPEYCTHTGIKSNFVFMSVPFLPFSTYTSLFSLSSPPLCFYLVYLSPFCFYSSSSSSTQTFIIILFFSTPYTFSYCFLYHHSFFFFSLFLFSSIFQVVTITIVPLGVKSGTL